MPCVSCRTENPDVATYCHRCGAALRGADATKGSRGSYAIQSAENVTQFALISTIMPQTNRQEADAYRWAFLITGAAVMALTFAGLIPAAILAAAFLVPIAYLVYVYDVNLWEDSPAPVVAGLFLLTGAVAALVSLVFFRWGFDHQFQSLIAGRGGRSGLEGIPIGSLLLFTVALPIIAEVVKNIGPTLLASRPQFDDMIDGLTFGVAAGTAYAAAETLVAFSPVFGAGIRTSGGVMTWLPIVLNLMVVKSLVYGTATGIAAATFSGRGEGYDGFTGRYVANFAFAAGMNVVFWLGVRLFGYLPAGEWIGLLWGLAVLAVLVIRVRVLMHTALIEAAVESAAVGARAKAATTEVGFCPECEMQLLPDSLFCIVCGTSVRATSGNARRAIRSSVGGDA